jgi:hypothetical protein
LRHHSHGRRARSYATYRASLQRLDDIHGLTDSAGHPLRFTQTHRLRHTRAAELLNDASRSMSCSATSGTRARR